MRHGQHESQHAARHRPARTSQGAMVSARRARSTPARRPSQAREACDQLQPAVGRGHGVAHTRARARRSRRGAPRVRRQLDRHGQELRSFRCIEMRSASCRRSAPPGVIASRVIPTRNLSCAIASIPSMLPMSACPMVLRTQPLLHRRAERTVHRQHVAVDVDASSSEEHRRRSISSSRPQRAAGVRRHTQPLNSSFWISAVFISVAK